MTAKINEQMEQINRTLENDAPMTYWYKFHFLILVTLLVLIQNDTSLAQSLKTGEIHTGISPKSDPSQTYSIYLPSKYTSKSTWPVLFGFSPSANGRNVVERHKLAAERFGWIVVASEASRNGDMNIAQRAANAMWKDVQTRFSIDEERLYSAGLSGGAIVADWFANSRPLAFAGTFLHARGDYSSIPKKKLTTFYVLLPGDNDFNLGESVRFTCLGRKSGTKIQLEVQKGGHSWASEKSCESLLRIAELRHRLPRSPHLDSGSLKLVKEEFDRLELVLAGPYFYCGWQQLEELVLIIPKKVKFHRRFQKLKKRYGARLKVEQEAWDKMETTCLFDAKFENRMPSIKSLQDVDQARRRLAKKSSGTTAVHLVLLSQKNAPMSFQRAIPRVKDQRVKKAYQDYLLGLKKVGIDFVKEAINLMKSKKTGMAIVALYHGAAIGQVTQDTLAKSQFRLLRKKPGFIRLKLSFL